MAIIAWQVDPIKQGVVRASVTLDGGDTSQELGLPEYADKTIQVSGTFGTSTVSVVGSNLVADTPTFPLHQAHDPAEDFSALATAIGAAVIENPSGIIASAAAGSGSDLVVTVVARAGRPT